MVLAVVAGVVVGMRRAGRLLQLGQPVRPHRVRAVRHRARRACCSPTGARPAATAAPGRCRAGWRRCPTGCGRTCWCGGCRGCRPCSPSSCAVVVPLMIDTNARYFLYSRMALIAIVVVSVTILTGWAGQLSLAQFALAGLGAMTMAGADLHLNLQFLPALVLAIAVCVGGRRDHGHPVVPGAGHVPGDRHPGLRQRRLRVAVPPAHLQRRPRRVPLRARPPAHRFARPQRPPHLLPRLPRRPGDDRAHGQPAAPLGRGSGARGRARQRAVGGRVHHRPPGDEAVGLRPRRRAGRVRRRAAHGPAHQRAGRPVPGRHVAVGRLDGRDRRPGVGRRARSSARCGSSGCRPSSAPTRPSACSPRASGCSC